MSLAPPQLLRVTHQGKPHEIAVRTQEGAGPPVVWLGGFKSDMTSTKAQALADAAAAAGRAFVRFDYSGHGESAGRFEDGTISTWLADALAVLDAFTTSPPVLVGSSMGGWIALRAAEIWRERGREKGRDVARLVLIAPAVDFTERLMWDAFSEAIRRQIVETGQWLRPSAYSPAPYPITRALIEDGRAHLMMQRPLHFGVPIHILQGAADPDVPLAHVQRFVGKLARDAVTLSIIPDGDHRLSRPEDIALLVRSVFPPSSGDSTACV